MLHYSLHPFLNWLNRELLQTKPCHPLPSTCLQTLGLGTGDLGIQLQLSHLSLHVICLSGGRDVGPLDGSKVVGGTIVQAVPHSGQFISRGNGAQGERLVGGGLGDGRNGRGQVGSKLGKLWDTSRDIVGNRCRCRGWQS